MEVTARNACPGTATDGESAAMPKESVCANQAGRVTTASNQRASAQQRSVTAAVIAMTRNPHVHALTDGVVKLELAVNFAT